MFKVHESDVIVWHEGDLGLDDADALAGRANVRFCLLDEASGWGSPPWLKAMPDSKFSAGYRFMIRFYAVTIWRTLDRLGYEWVMRMDDDSSLSGRDEGLTPMGPRIFERPKRVETWTPRQTTDVVRRTLRRARSSLERPESERNERSVMT